MAEDGNTRWTLPLDACAGPRRGCKPATLGEAGFLRRHPVAATDELVAVDDRTIRFRMKRPFALLPDALAKISPNMAAIMPERLARTDPFTPIPEIVRSGSFRSLPGERVSGARVVYERFADYVPRRSGVAGVSSGPERCRSSIGSSDGNADPQRQPTVCCGASILAPRRPARTWFRCWPAAQK